MQLCTSYICVLVFGKIIQNNNIVIMIFIVVADNYHTVWQDQFQMKWFLNYRQILIIVS